MFLAFDICRGWRRRRWRLIQLNLEQHLQLHWRRILVVNCSICVHKLRSTSVHSSLFDSHSQTQSIDLSQVAAEYFCFLCTSISGNIIFTLCTTATSDKPQARGPLKPLRSGSKGDFYLLPSHPASLTAHPIDTFCAPLWQFANRIKVSRVSLSPSLSLLAI